MSYTIRMVLSPDEEDRKTEDILCLLDRLTFPSDYPMGVKKRWWWIIRNKDDRAIGFAGLKRRDKDSAFLCRVGVLKKHRGNNLQMRTIKLRETQARKEGFKHLVTYTVNYNFSSINNLIRAGFTVFKPANAELAKFLYFYKCLDDTLTRTEIREWQNNTEL